MLNTENTVHLTLNIPYQRIRWLSPRDLAAIGLDTKPREGLILIEDTVSGEFAPQLCSLDQAAAIIALAIAEDLQEPVTDLLYEIAEPILTRFPKSLRTIF